MRRLLCLRVLTMVSVAAAFAAGCQEPESLDATAQEAVGPGGIARGSTWSYWDRGGDLGTAWRGGSFDDSAWARGAGPLGYGEGYLATNVGYGGNAAQKYVTTYVRTQFTVADPAAVSAMRGDLMYDDGVVVYLNGTEISRVGIAGGMAVNASTLATGHEAANSYQAFDWTAHRGLLRAGTNTIAVEIHQAERSSSDLVFDLGLALTTATPPPAGDDIPRNAVWTYWDRGGDLGTAWRGRTFDDSTWARGPGSLGYGETYHSTTIGYGGNPSNKYITSYFRARFTVDDPAAVTEMLADLRYDDGVVVYLNGTEVVRFSMPAGPVTAATRASDHEPGGGYEQYEWSSVRNLLVPGVNVIAAEVHQTGPASSDLTWDMAFTIETYAPPPPPPTVGGIPAGSTWTFFDGGTDLGNAWRATPYSRSGWDNGAAPLGFGESYIATQTAPGSITTYLRHTFDSEGGITALSLDAKYDDGFVAYLNGTEVLRVGLPAGAVSASTVAAGHEASGYQHFSLDAYRNLVVGGTNTLAVEVHQAAASSSDLVWDAALVAGTTEPGDWRPQTSGSTRALFDVWFTDTQHGWVVGEGGTLLRTTDGGATWDQQETTAGNTLLRNVQFADAQHGWVGGVQILLRTTDGGNSWTRLPFVPPSLAHVSFVSPTTGWMASRDIYRTDDGGLTWQLQLATDTYLVYDDVEMVDSLHGWALARSDGGNGDIDGSSVIFHTSDGGVTWQRQLSMGDWESGLVGIAPAGPVQAWTFGVASNHTTLGENKYVTRDGVTWQSVPDSANRTGLFDAQFVDVNRGWACGYAGSIIHTDDAGATWRRQRMARWQYWEDHSRSFEPSFYAIYFVDADHGWAVGTDGTILTTDHGGGAGI